MKSPHLSLILISGLSNLHLPRQVAVEAHDPSSSAFALWRHHVQVFGSDGFVYLPNKGASDCWVIIPTFSRIFFIHAPWTRNSSSRTMALASL